MRGRSAASADIQPVAHQGDVNEPEEAVGFMGKTKEACVKTGKAAVAGVALVGWTVASAGFWIIDGMLDTDDGFDPDPLWRQGAGFNNPNHDRIKNGQEPVDF